VSPPSSPLSNNQVDEENVHEQKETSHIANKIKTRSNRKQRKSVTKTVKVKFPCKSCNRSFSSKYYAKFHELSHKPLEELEVENDYQEKCGECDEIFFNKEKFQTHCEMHQGDKRHKCPTCGQAFTLEFNLISHLFEHLGVEDKTTVKDWIWERLESNVGVSSKRLPKLGLPKRVVIIGKRGPGRPRKNVKRVSDNN
jgi:uncharacterized Zn-finger protein